MANINALVKRKKFLWGTGVALAIAAAGGWRDAGRGADAVGLPPCAGWRGTAADGGCPAHSGARPAVSQAAQAAGGGEP